MSDALEYITSELPELLRLLRVSDVRELELEENGMQVRLRRAPTVEGEWESIEQPTELPLALERDTVEVVAPMVGTFYRAAEPDSPPLAEEGSEVEDATIVGIIESLQVLNPVPAGCSGQVFRVLATDGQPVQYGQPLFEVKPGG